LVSRYQNVTILDIIGAKGDGGGGNNWGSSQTVTTKISTPGVFTGLMPFLSPNQQCQSTEKK